jgi:phosphatidylinositol 4-phosphatase
MYVSPFFAVVVHFANGIQVNWPKLNKLPWAVESYNDALAHVERNPVVGPLVGKHERGKSEARLGFMEEGKKRIE